MSTDVSDYFANNSYKNLQISPDGRFYIIHSDIGDQDRLVVINRADNKPISSFEVGKNQRISGVHWVTDERFIFQSNKRVGLYDDREGPPSLYAANYDGRLRKELFVWGVAGFRVLSLLPDDPDNILIARYFYRDGGQPKSHLLNIHNGKTRYLADQPRDAQVLFADNDGAVRLSYAYRESSDDSYGKGQSVFYFKRLGSDAWEELSVEGFSKGDALEVAGFSLDNRYAYFFSNMGADVQEVFEFDTQDATVRQVTENSVAAPDALIWGLDGSLLGVESMPGRIERVYLQDNHSARLVKGVTEAFGGQRVTITSATEDNKMAVVLIASDTNAGEFYLFNAETFEAKFIAARNRALDPKLMAEMQPITLEARDGVELRGYLTLPAEHEEGSKPPLIVKVHGGPHGVRDSWGFSPENQYFAAHGFAVLQINFRGSGGYGRKFLEAGYGEWGRKMQDDVTDATLWAVENGYANKDRICIYGASYGGYAALMGVVREPDLYQCSVGYVGVYSLPLMYKDGDISESKSGNKYLERVIGTNDAELKANSPLYNVDKIKVPVFLVHGSEDVRVPISHYEALKEAFDKQGVTYQTMVREDGHGFQKEEHKFELYPRLIAFFKQHLGE